MRLSPLTAFRLPFDPASILALLLLATVPARPLAAQDTFVWPVSTPEEQGVDGGLLADLVAKVRREQMAIHSFVLVRHGAVVSENYFGAYSRSTPHILYSVSKSFTSAAFGIAYEQGLIGSLDQRVVDFFPERTIQNRTPAKEAMTLRHLLTMSSGHSTETFGRITASADWVQTYLDLPVDFQPGSRFAYDSGATMMLSAILQKRAGMNLLSYAQQVLFTPLGIARPTWESGPGNLTAGGWGLSLTPLDMAKFGLLFLNRGRWGNTQVVPASWVDECSRLQISNGSGSPWNSGYSYQFWLNDFGGYRADGYGGQFIFILPQYDAVAVFTAGYADGAPAMQLMKDFVVPALGEADAFPDIGATAPPQVRLAPASLVVQSGDEADFHVRAAGRNLSYQWFHNGAVVPGATGSTLRVPGVDASKAGMYAVLVSNPQGSVMTDLVQLHLGRADESARLINLSARAKTGTGDETLIIGLILAGDRADEGLPLLVRGIGPSLQDRGITTWAPDPSLTLFDARAPIALNRGWRGATLLAQAVGWAGAFPLPGTSRDAALHTVLRPGGYTVHVNASVAGSVALAEFYDASPTKMRDSTRLTNLSARAWTEPGDGTLTAGFVIRGSGRRDVLVRALGPSLAERNVGHVLGDPELRLFDVEGRVIASNDDWGGGAPLREAFTRFGALPMAENSRESALVVTLPAGAYTAQVVGRNGARGVALIEFYSP